jgi:hypothetical protein
LASTWWIVNFTTSRGARDPQRHGRHFATSTRHGACPISSSFVASSSCARCKRERTCYINKVKALADQLTCLEVPMRVENVVMTLLESLPPSYEYLIIALETLPMQDLTMEFVTT